MAKPELERMTLHPAEGGVMSVMSTRTKRPGKGGGGMYDYEEERAVHPCKEHLMAHIEKHMGHCFSEESGERNDSPKEEKSEREAESE